MSATATKYQNFDLTILPVRSGYHAGVSSPAGEETADLLLADLALLAGRLGTNRTIAADASSEEHIAALFGAMNVTEAGSLLYDWIFRDGIRIALWRSLDQAKGSGEGLRIRLRLNEAPELMNLPWEWLHDSERDKSFALDRRTPIVRYLDLPEPVTPLSITTPIEVVTMVAIPRGTEKLDAAGEREKLALALKPGLDAGYVRLVVIEEPRLAALRRQLSEGPCHVFHFIGHGQAGGLLMEYDDGDVRHVSAQEIGGLLWNYERDWDPPRLVVLNSCEGSLSESKDPFTGVAQGLMQQGIPAVIAMQTRISDPASISFSEGFYESISAGAPLEAALAQGRLFIMTNGDEAEWGTPVLYTRLPEARILDVEPLTEGQRQAREELATLGRFWHPTDASEILVLFGKWPQVVTETGEREEAVSLAYAMLLGELKSFLSQWYTSVELSDDLTRVDGSQPVIALGGPLSNPLSKRVGDEEKLPIWFRGLPYTRDSQRELGTDDDTFAARIGGDGAIESDVGFVARMFQDTAQPLYVIAGCYGAGTLGAARCLMSPAQIEKLGITESTGGVQGVVRSTTRGWDAEPGELIQIRVW